MSFIFYFSIGLAVLAGVFYHVIQKVTPSAVNPVLALAVTYLVAAFTCVLILPLFPIKDGLAAELRRVNWASIALGVTIVALELGFLLAYRAGWDISLAGLAAHATIALILLPVGLVFFKEKLSPVNLMGVAIAVIGLIMINKK